MKLAVISFFHTDQIICSSKHLSKEQNIEIDLFLVFNQNQKSNNVVDFSNLNVKNGIQDKETTKHILGKEILQYAGDKLSIHILVLNSSKVYDIRNVKMINKFTKQLREKHYDLFHLNGNSLYEIYFHFRLWKYPRVHTIHDPTPHSGEGSGLSFIRQKTLLKLPKVTFIAPSQYTKDTIVKEYKIREKKVKVIYFGEFDLYREYQMEKPNEVSGELKDFYLFYGRLSAYKGADLLMETYQNENPLQNEMPVIIAGKGDFSNTLSESANKNIHLINRFLSNEELVYLISKSKAVLCPYKDATQSGVAMTVFAFNRPLIANNVGAFSEVIINNKTGKLIDQISSKALASSLEEFSNENIDYTEGIRKAKQNADFSWKNINEETINLFKNLTN